MGFIRSSRTMVTIVAVLISCIPGTIAEELQQPRGDIVLRITGNISRTNTGNVASFDLEMLDALPQTRFQTSTIWTEGKITFSGVSLDDLLAAVGSKGTTLRASALNDYAVDIPASEAVRGGPIVATRADGVRMSVREKGPLWIVYPFDLQTRYRSEITYSRSIWQLHEIAVLD